MWKQLVKKVIVATHYEEVKMNEIKVAGFGETTKQKVCAAVYVIVNRSRNTGVGVVAARAWLTR